MVTQRYFIELAFNGSRYHGWQVQHNAISVQELLNKSLATLLRQPIETTGAGRTDAGVHATQLYAHVDVIMTDGKPQLETMLRGLNALLPDDISVKRIIPVHATAHARFDATARSYEYHIHFNKDPFKTGFSWQLRDVPDLALMNKAAAIIKTYTDFSCFSKAHTQVKTNNCKITRAEWVATDHGMVFHITADRFLRNMVRAIVGTLMQVGKKEMPPEAIHEVIESKDRSSAGASVPACGLYLTEVLYPYNLSTP